LKGDINTGNQDTTPNEAGYDFNVWGITGGVDYRFSDNFVLGGAFGYLNTETDLKAKGGSLDVDGYSLTLYGTYYQSSQFYLDGSLSYGWNDYEQHRNLDYNLDVPDGGVNQVLRADYNGDYFSMSLGGGYDLNRGALTFGPLSQLQYIDANVDGYSEQASNPSADGSGWPTVINDQNYKSLTFSLGGQLTYAMSQSWGVLLPQARFEWVHEFKNDARIINGFFLQDTSQEIFSFATNKPDANYFNLGVGASAQFAQGRSAFFYYQSLLGYDNVTSNLFNLGIRWEF
jgi:outer membrane lipase/esterase